MITGPETPRLEPAASPASEPAVDPPLLQGEDHVEEMEDKIDEIEDKIEDFEDKVEAMKDTLDEIEGPPPREVGLCQLLPGAFYDLKYAAGSNAGKWRRVYITQITTEHIYLINQNNERRTYLPNRIMGAVPAYGWSADEVHRSVHPESQASCSHEGLAADPPKPLLSATENYTCSKGHLLKRRKLLFEDMHPPNAEWEGYIDVVTRDTCHRKLRLGSILWSCSSCTLEVCNLCASGKKLKK